MWDKLKDLLGINKYVTCWDFKASSIRLSGRSDETYGQIYSRETAEYISDELNKIYGPDSHWIERVK
jgi:hypothetical protein